MYETSLICDLCYKVKAFSQKLTLFEIHLSRSCFIHFYGCEKHSQKAITPFPYLFAQDIISGFKQNQFLKILSYLDACSSKIRLLENPFDSVIENLPYDLHNYGSYRFAIKWHPQEQIQRRKFDRILQVPFITYDQYIHLRKFAHEFTSLFGLAKPICVNRHFQL